MAFRVDVPRLLALLGIEAKHRGRAHVAKCPNPKHDDHHPSWKIIDSPSAENHGSHHCQSCKFGGGPWELAAAVWGVSLETAGEKLAPLLKGGKPEPAPLPPDGLRVRIVGGPVLGPRFKLPHGVVAPARLDDWLSGPLAYTRARGVTDEQIARWSIGYAVEGSLAFRVVIPVVTRGVLRTFAGRSWLTGDESRYDSGSERDGAVASRALFGEPRWDRSLRVATVCEGTWSMLALERVSFPNPTALLGCELTPARQHLLERFDVLIAATDPDAAGDAAADAMVAAFGRRHRVVRLVLPLSPDDCAPDVLRDARDNLARDIGVKLTFPERST